MTRRLQRLRTLQSQGSSQSHLSTSQVRTELEVKGYNSDVVYVRCIQCRRKATCKWKRNPTPGKNYGRPMIELPEDWKVIFTYGDSKQDVMCDRCDPQELQEGILLK